MIEIYIIYGVIVFILLWFLLKTPKQRVLTGILMSSIFGLVIKLGGIPAISSNEGFGYSAAMVALSLIVGGMLLAVLGIIGLFTNKNSHTKLS